MQASAVLSGKNSLIKWASGFPYALVLASNGYTDRYGEYELLAAVSHTALPIRGDAFFIIEKLQQQHPWLFGYFGYDLKNRVEALSSENPDRTGFADAVFFAPQKLIAVKRSGSVLLENVAQNELETILSGPAGVREDPARINWQAVMAKDAYIRSVNNIRDHIRRGDIYETNFCQEFYAQKKLADPAAAFSRLMAKAPVPFAAFFRAGEHCALSLSPERFLCKRGPKLVSQPIKGTAPRNPDAVLDAEQKTRLQNDSKERAENIMITDLVRNDMARSAIARTVNVEELCRVYSYPSVHQMTSTVTGLVRDDFDNGRIIRNLFPMGSMTGAPKIRAMQLMEKYEQSRRGLYSGALGYFAPGGDFDFSVVIRTLLYNAATGYLSYHTGSAITNASDPEKEYAECLLKREVVEEI